MATFCRKRTGERRPLKQGIPDNLDVYRTATIIIGEYGEDALIHAAMRHDQLLEEGDVDGVLVWGRIVSAVRELCAEVGREGETVH